MNREEFEAAYAYRSGVTIDWLHEHGRYAEPCDCGWQACHGWQMGHVTPPAHYREPSVQYERQDRT